MDRPLTPSELRKKILSGELQFVPAKSEIVEDYEKEVHELILMIAPFMVDATTPEACEKWAEEVWVSDMSQIGDFFMGNDPDGQKCVDQLSAKLGFPILSDDYLCDIAILMRGM